LSHMDANGYDIVQPELGDSGMSTQPMLDLSAGYVQRALDQLPKQGDGDPWRVQMNYSHDVEQLRHGSVTDPHLHFGAANHAASRTPEAPAWV
jgi:monooxygenase